MIRKMVLPVFNVLGTLGTLGTTIFEIQEVPARFKSLERHWATHPIKK